MHIKKCSRACGIIIQTNHLSEADVASSSTGQTPDTTPAKRHETLAFLFLAFVLFPILAIVFVGGFGFVVWMQHLIVGPPGT